MVGADWALEILSYVAGAFVAVDLGVRRDVVDDYKQEAPMMPIFRIRSETW